MLQWWNKSGNICSTDARIVHGCTKMKMIAPVFGFTNRWIAAHSEVYVSTSNKHWDSVEGSPTRGVSEGKQILFVSWWAHNENTDRHIHTWHLLWWPVKLLLRRSGLHLSLCLCQFSCCQQEYMLQLAAYIPIINGNIVWGDGEPYRGAPVDTSAEMCLFPGDDDVNEERTKMQNRIEGQFWVQQCRTKSLLIRFWCIVKKVFCKCVFV